jgi:hypothetical protein
MKTLIRSLCLVTCVWVAGATPNAPDDGQSYPIIFDNDERLKSALGISIEPFRSRYNIYSVEWEYSADSARVVAILPDGAAQIWDARSGKPLGGRIEHDYSLLSVKFSPAGTKVATASFDRTARVWSALDAKPLTKALLHNSSVLTAEFNHGGTKLVTVEESGLIHIWDIESGKELGKPMKHEHALVARFDGDKHVVSATDLEQRNEVIVWDIASRKRIRRGARFAPPQGRDDSDVSAITSPDGARQLIADVRGRLRLRNLKTSAWVGGFLNSGKSPDLAHKCFYYGDGGIMAHISEEFLQSYLALGFSKTSACMAVVSPIRFDPETGSRLATFVLVDPTALVDQGGRDDADSTEELPFEFPQCFHRAHPIEDCAWKYHPKTGAKLKYTRGDGLLEELDNYSGLQRCDPKNPNDCAYAMYTDGAAGPSASASAVRAARGRPPRTPRVSPQTVRNRLAGRRRNP